MPVRIEYKNDKIGLVLHHEGSVTCQELIDAIFSVYENDDVFLKLKYWIGDRTGCTEFLPDPDCLMKIADKNKLESHRNPGMLLALVAPKDLEFGMSRMFQSYAAQAAFNTQTFRSREDADKWIIETLD